MESHNNATKNRCTYFVSAASQTPLACPPIKIESTEVPGLGSRKIKYLNSKLRGQRRQARDAEPGKEPGKEFIKHEAHGIW
jgi:hypothetical protein